MREPDYQRGDVKLYLGDCRDILPHLSGVDLTLTDPPYGIGLNTDYSRFKSNRVKGKAYDLVVGDDEGFDPALLWDKGRKQVVFGANNWPQLIPFNPMKDGWIVWDKRTNESADAILGSPFEMAVVRGQRCYRFIRLQHCGVRNADGDHSGRFHPTQKPVVLMQRILDIVPGKVVCDPYMGSGTVGLACIRHERQFIGIEIDENHFATACARIDRELDQPMLFQPEQTEPSLIQQGMFDGEES